MEMTASKGRVEVPVASGLGADEVADESISERRLVDDAIIEGAAFDDWVLPPSMSFWVANGSSYDPGTVLTTMFSALTPCAFSFEIVPSTRAEMTASFHLAWMIPIRRPDPSYDFGGGGRPLIVGSDMLFVVQVIDKCMRRVRV